MQRNRLRKLARHIRKMDNVTGDPNDARDNGVVSRRMLTNEGHAMAAGFSMHAWFGKSLEEEMRTAMSIAGSACYLFADEVLASDRGQQIDVVTAGTKVLGLDDKTAWALFAPRKTHSDHLTADDAARACERVAAGATGDDVWKDAGSGDGRTENRDAAAA